jgi:hypothetical protein
MSMHTVDARLGFLFMFFFNIETMSLSSGVVIVEMYS